MQEVTRLRDLHATSQRECHTLQDEVAQLKDELHQEIKRASVSVIQEQLSERRNSDPSADKLKTVGLRPLTASASRGCRLQPEPEAEMSRPPTAPFLRPAAAQALQHLEAHTSLRHGTSSTSPEPEAEMLRPATAGMSPAIAINSYEPEAEASRPNSSVSLRRPVSASTWSLRPLSAASDSETVRPMSAAGRRGCSRSNAWSGRVNPRWDTAEFLKSEALILGEASQTEMVFCNTVPVVLEEGVCQSPSARSSSLSDDYTNTAHEDPRDADVNRGPLLDSSCQELAGSIGRALRKGGNSTANLLNHKDLVQANPASASTQQQEELRSPSVHEASTCESLCELPAMETQSTALGSIGLQSATLISEEHEAADESCSHNLSDLLTITTSTEALMWSQKSIDLKSPAGVHAECSDSFLLDGRNQDSTWLASTTLSNITMLDSALLVANTSVQEDVPSREVSEESDNVMTWQQTVNSKVSEESGVIAALPSLQVSEEAEANEEEIHAAEEEMNQSAQQQQVLQEACINARYRSEEEANWNAVVQEDERLRPSTSAPDDLAAPTLLGAERSLAPLQVQRWGEDVSSSSAQGLLEDEEKWTPRRTCMKRDLERKGVQVEEFKEEIDAAKGGNLLLAVKLRKKAQSEAQGEAQQPTGREHWGDSMTYVDDGFSSDWWGYGAWVPQDAAPGSLRLEAEVNEAEQLGSRLYYSGKAKLETLQHLLTQCEIAVGPP